MHGRPPIAAFLHRLRTREAQPKPLPTLQAELRARGVVLEVRALQRYEAGQRTPSLEVLVLIGDLLGATAGDWYELLDASRAVHPAPHAGEATPTPRRTFRARQLLLTAGTRARARGAA